MIYQGQDKDTVRDGLSLAIMQHLKFVSIYVALVYHGVESILLDSAKSVGSEHSDPTTV